MGELILLTLLGLGFGLMWVWKFLVNDLAGEDGEIIEL